MAPRFEARLWVSEHTGPSTQPNDTSQGGSRSGVQRTELFGGNCPLWKLSRQTDDGLKKKKPE